MEGSEQLLNSKGMLHSCQVFPSSLQTPGAKRTCFDITALEIDERTDVTGLDSCMWGEEDSTATRGVHKVFYLQVVSVGVRGSSAERVGRVEGEGMKWKERNVKNINVWKYRKMNKIWHGDTRDLECAMWGGAVGGACDLTVGGAVTTIIAVFKSHGVWVLWMIYTEMCHVY